MLGLTSLLNDTAGEMISPLLPHFPLTVLLGNRSYLGVIGKTGKNRDAICNSL